MSDKANEDASAGRQSRDKTMIAFQGTYVCRHITMHFYSLPVQ